MANARMANHDSDLYVSFELIGAPDPTLDTTAFPGIQILDLDSTTPLAIPEETQYKMSAVETGEASEAIPSGLAPGQLWLNGGVLMCACPDCRAPMSIRFWLMIADCWQCGTSIELSEEQEREARRLLAEQRDTTPAAAPKQTSPGAKPASASKASSKSQQAEQHQSVRNGDAAAKAPPPAASPAQPAQNRPPRPDAPPIPARRAAPVRSTRRPPPRRPVSALENRVRARLQKSARATGVTAVVRDLFG
ncbi:MAG: hypothetical protein WD070_05865, partial [Pirellulaceae bacterium]